MLLIQGAVNTGLFNCLFTVNTNSPGATPRLYGSRVYPIRVNTSDTAHLRLCLACVKEKYIYSIRHRVNDYPLRGINQVVVYVIYV